jgi:gliding motility-associated lipoprotein GldB
MNLKSLIWLLIPVFLFSCKQKNKLEVDISNIKSTVSVKRFEKIFYTAYPKDLPQIKNEFRSVFPHDNDSLWIEKMKDTLEQELFRATAQEYKDFSKQKNDLENLFKHVRYYYPNFKDPTVITVMTNISYEQRIVYQNDTLYLSLDVFLGKDHPFYKKYLDYPKYIVDSFEKEQLIVNSAKEIARKVQVLEPNRSFVEKMVAYGKLLYTTQAFLPKISEKEIINYTTEKYNWVKDNEKMIWTYIIEKELLYSTDPKLERRFLLEAPFTKFYLDIDNKTPGRIGEWIGLQIVKSYMDNNDVTLREMLKKPNQIIFKKSKYKPKR